jgi:hypothetical protein
MRCAFASFAYFCSKLFFAHSPEVFLLFKLLASIETKREMLGYGPGSALPTIGT